MHCRIVKDKLKKKGCKKNFARQSNADSADRVIEWFDGNDNEVNDVLFPLQSQHFFLNEQRVLTPSHRNSNRRIIFRKMEVGFFCNAKRFCRKL